MKNNQALPVIGAQRMTSLEIAEVTGKQHKHLMRDIRNMEAAWEKVNGSKYEGLGLAQDRLFIYYSKDGKQKERTYLVWTPKGAEMIDKLIFEKGKRNKEPRIARI